MKTLSRSPKGSKISWSIQIPTKAAAYASEEEATELFGVLLDNAVKWSDTEVRVTARGESGLCMIIEDDGPGAPEDYVAKLGQRGVRLDEATEGSGLGLSIAAYIVDAYGGEMHFGTRAPHGFRVTVTLPGHA